MVDTAPQPTPAPAAPTPAAPAAAPAQAQPAGPPPGGGQSATQILLDQRAPQRAGLLDGLRGLRPGGETTPAPTAAAAGNQQASAAPAAAPGTNPAAAATPEPAGAAPAQPSQAPPASSSPDAGAAPTQSPEAEHPGMAQVRKAEQHLRAKLADERAQLQADFDRQKSVWQQQVGELDRYKALLANARQDPTALFQAAGFGESDYEPLAQLAYAMSPEGAKDPRVAQGRKIAAHESLARRAQQSEQDKMRAEITALREEQQRRDATAAAEQNVQRYLHTVTRAVGDTSPHARYAMTRAPEATQQRLLAVADRLYMESGPSNDLRDVPTPIEVIKAYEQERATHIRDVLAELEALGVDPRTFGKPAPGAGTAIPATGAGPANAPAAQVTAPPAAPAQPAAAPAQPAPATPPATPPAQPQNEDDRRRLMLEELRKLRFAG